MLSCGIDLALNSRFSQKSESFLSRIFTANEIKAAEDYPPMRKCEYFASRFAAKEALSKALGTGFAGMSPTEAEVHTDEKGAPYFVLSGRAAKAVGTLSISLSISHEAEYSIAMVVLDGEK